MNYKDLFHTITTNAYTYKDLVLRQLVGFNQYFIDVEIFKFTFYRWCKEQNKFPTIVIITRHWHIIGIPTRPNWNIMFFFLLWAFWVHFINVISKQTRTNWYLSIKIGHLIHKLVDWNPPTLHLHVRSNLSWWHS